MKKKILAIVLGLTLCLGMTGCTRTGSKNYDNHSNYDELMNKVIDTAVKMRDTFKKYI